MAFHPLRPAPFRAADAAHRRALEAGAEESYPVADHDYGERSGGLRDRWGNSWFLATVTDPVRRSGG